MIARLLLLPALTATALLAACGSSDGDSTPTTTTTASPEPTASASPSPTATTTATPTATPSVTATVTATTTDVPGFPIEVLFSRHPESDDDPAAVFPVERVSPDAGVARFATRELLEGPTPAEEAAGFFSTWTSFGYGDDSDCGGERFQITIEDGVATVRFCVTVMLLGAIADGQAQSTLTATLEQFSTVDEVVILNRQGDCMFDLSGLNLCL